MRLLGPNAVDLVTFVAFMGAHVLHMIHRIFAAKAITENNVVKNCLAVVLSKEPMCDTTMQEACANIDKVQTHNLQLNSAIGALLICTILIRRLSYRIISCVVIVSSFLVIIKDSSMHCFFTIVFSISWIFGSIFEDRILRLRLFKQLNALQNLEVFNRSTRKAQSILNHMIKNVAIGMEESAQNLRQLNTKSNVVSDKIRYAEKTMEYLQSVSSNIVMSTHYTQMQIDIEEDKYKLNPQK